MTEAERLGGLKTGKPLLGAATSAAVAGDIADATALLERARARAPTGRDVYREPRARRRGPVAWRAGRSRTRRACCSALARARRRWTARYLGGLAARRGPRLGGAEDADGRAALERRPRRSAGRGPSTPRPWFDPRRYLLLAGAYERTGDGPKALERVDELLQLWQRADPDLPRLAEAKALKKRLAPKTRSAQPRSGSRGSPRSPGGRARRG